MKVADELLPRSRGAANTHRTTLMRAACGTALVIGALSFADSASAQATSDSATRPEGVDDQSLGEIVVTAQKRQERINDVPMSITAATGATLAARGIDNIEELVKITPGLQVSSGFYGAPVFTLRGVGFYDNSLGARPAVTVYTDEISLPYGTMAKGVGLDVERVEILKGPQGTLFGQNSTGGAINYIVGKPTHEFKYGLDAGIGRFAQGEIGGFVSGPISDTLRVRIAVEETFGGDWQKSYTRNDSLGKKDFLNGRVLLDWEPSDRLRFELNLNGWRDKSDSQAGQLFNTLPITAGSLPAVLNYPRAPQNGRAADWTLGFNGPKNDSFYQAGLRSEYDLNDEIILTSLTAYSKLKVGHKTDIDGESFNIYQATSYTGGIKSFSQELRLSGTHDRINWVLGANYAHDTLNENQIGNVSDTYARLTFVPFGIPNWPDFAGRTSTSNTSKSVFGNLDYKITDQMSAVGGLRYTKATGHSSTCLADPGNGITAAGFAATINFIRGQFGLSPITIAPGACATILNNLTAGPATANLDEHNLSWRLGLNWKPLKDTLIYANVSKGYKAGNFTFINPTVEDQAKPATQEAVLSYEAGFKASLLDRRIQMNGAVFYADYKNKQFTGRSIANPNLFGPVEALVNVPKSRLYGAELQVDAKIADGLTVGGDILYLKSKVLGSFVNYNYQAILTDFGGEAFPFTSKWQYSLHADYTQPINDKLAIFGMPSLRYQSSTYAAFGQAADQKIPGYALLDLSAGVKARDGSWSLTVFGDNVTNKYYVTSAFSAAESVVHMAGMPATYGIRLTLRGGS